MHAIKKTIHENQNQPMHCGNTAKTPSSKNTTNQATSSHSVNLNKISARIKRLFARFAVVYGHIWQSQYKQENQVKLADKEWSETLRNITDENIELAFLQCKKRFEMPPTLPAFYQLCRQYQPAKSINYFVEEKVQVASDEIVKTHLEVLKRICKKA